MEWISNANVVASLILAIFGIGGYFFGIVTYLKKKASALPQQTTTLTQTSSLRQQESPVPLKSISWLEWIEIFAQGLVDTADFLLNLISAQDVVSESTPAGRMGFCAFLCGLGIFFGGLLLIGAIALVLSIFGVNNALNVGAAIACVLLFLAFSLIYIYQVGLRLEKIQLEHRRVILNQQETIQ